MSLRDKPSVLFGALALLLLVGAQFASQNVRDLLILLSAVTAIGIVDVAFWTRLFTD